MSAKTLRNKVRKSSCLCVFALLSLILQGCQPERADLTAFDGHRAFAEVEALVQFSPRDAGTPNGRKAAEHIFQRLEQHGVAAEIDTFKDNTPAGEKTMHNVIGRIPGKSDRWIILGSHFDTVPGIENFQGANDSGSSTGVLLELARIFSHQTPRTGIIFAFFDGEEGIAHYRPGDGLHGSRHMAKNLQETSEIANVDAMILLDMVGDPDLHFTVPVNSAPNLVRELFEVARSEGVRNRFSLSHSVIIDDHVPFLEAGIPSIDLIDFKFGSAPDLNDYWHTEADKLQNISAESLEITGRITLQLVAKLVLDQYTE